jgi:fructokinase
MKNGSDGYSISAIGEDALGDELSNAINDAGIKSILQRNAWPTSTVEVALKNGIPEYTHRAQRGVGSHRAHPRTHRNGRQSRCGLLRHTCPSQPRKPTTPSSKLLKHTKPGAMKFFDINLRGDHYSKELITELLWQATVLKLNDAETAAAAGYVRHPRHIRRRCMPVVHRSFRP